MSVQTVEPAKNSGAAIGVLLSLTLLGLLALMWLALSLATTTFWTENNIDNLLRQGSMIAILAIGETFVIITAGIDLSVGAIVGFCSLIVALLLGADYPIWLAIVDHTAGRRSASACSTPSASCRSACRRSS